MSVKGKRREQKEFVKYVGVFEGKVVAINPSTEEFNELLGIELKEDSKATEYLGDSKDGNTYLRLNFWLKNVKNDEIFSSPISFFLEDKERENKDGTKKQYINNVGVCTWADDVNNLPDWFTEREYRVAKVGEEEFYEFLRIWLGELDYRDAETVLHLEWKKLMKGNVSDLKNEINGEYCTNIGCLATVVTREKDGETKEYQGVYNKAFVPAYAIKNLRLVDYTDPKNVEKIKAKKVRDLKAHERFVLKVTGEYGCNDYYILKDLQEYNPELNVAASNETLFENSDPSF